MHDMFQPEDLPTPEMTANAAKIVATDGPYASAKQSLENLLDEDGRNMLYVLKRICQHEDFSERINEIDRIRS